MKMSLSVTELSVPDSLHTLLEGVTTAVIKHKPVDTAEFVALYFQDFIAFHRDNLNLDLQEVVKKFDFKYENLTGELVRKASYHRDTSLSNEPQKKEASTDTEEDQLLEDLAIEYSSKVIQCPSAVSSVAENKSSTGPDGASSPEGPELAYVPADPEQLAAHVLAMASREAGQPPPYSNVWTLYCLTDLRQGQKPPSPGQLPQVSAPIYAMREENKRGDIPAFILVGSTVQTGRDWQALPSHAVFTQQGAGARRLTVVPVPVARPADEETGRPGVPDFISVAIPLDNVMSAKQG
ncbi:calcium-binding tyrosine phosphorylation-regulated protein [Cygnus atratus]|uniref:calcium-binding tyrosine phosphorylation-regulated protein n=1 Tax=Cygnus atratus TaxID=8868 RepID=UPI0021B84795|nr:calcium-binding tyrosine phosphorylation-regulated protein [Cygnus atratus]